MNHIPNYPKKTIRTIVDAVHSGATSAQVIAREYLDRIAAHNDALHAYLEVYSDVEAQAAKVDERIKNGEKLPLAGVCIGLKDNIVREGFIASAGSQSIKNYVAPYSASVITHLQNLGAIFLGRCNMDEFAMGSSTENSSYGPSKNPHDVSRVPGGSSGGSASALAADLATVTLGSDTGGSIRQPAGLCGVVGLMPTYGHVSRYGLMAMGSSLDQIGPFTHTVEDAKIMYEHLAQYDAKDSTSVPLEKRVPECARNKKIGVPYAFIERDGVNADVLANFKATLARYEKAGYEIVPIELPLAHYALSVYYILMPAEVSTNLARFDGVRFGGVIDGATPNETYMKTRGALFGSEVKRRVMLGSYVLSHGYYDAFYKKATALRAAIIADFNRVFKEVSFIATPTSPVEAFMFGEKSKDPLAMYLADIFTVPVNIAQIPAISVPSGMSPNNMPYGFQLMTAAHNDTALFEAGSVLE